MTLGRIVLPFLCIAVSVVYAKEWALIVAGSMGWSNYRHQADSAGIYCHPFNQASNASLLMANEMSFAQFLRMDEFRSDVCHAYHVLSKHGIPDENIVVMMYDDIAHHSVNPYKGKLFNKPHGPDVYAGVPKDYTAREVTPENFLKIMSGEEMKGIGTGKTIASGPDDHVFVFFSDHGATGLVAFPHSELHMKDLIATLTKMHADKKFAKLVFYLESCESGSMFRNHLPADMNIYAMTASDYDESSWGCYCQTDMNLPCLGDLFSVNWMQDSDRHVDLMKETIDEQHTYVKTKTDKSRVQQYGDLKFLQDEVGEFQGDKQCKTCGTNETEEEEITGLVPSRDIPLYNLHMSLERARNPRQREQVLKQISWFHQKRAYVDSVVQDIVSKSMPTSTLLYQQVMTSYPPQLKQIDCHYAVTKTFSRYCFSFAENEYVMRYSRVLANLCEAGIDTKDLRANILAACANLKNKPVGIQ